MLESADASGLPELAPSAPVLTAEPTTEAVVLAAVPATETDVLTAAPATDAAVPTAVPAAETTEQACSASSMPTSGSPCFALTHERSGRIETAPGCG